MTVSSSISGNTQTTTIERLLVKGPIEDPQVLFVIGTTCLHSELWVQLKLEESGVADTTPDTEFQISDPEKPVEQQALESDPTELEIPVKGYICELANIRRNSGANAPKRDAVYSEHAVIDDNESYFSDIEYEKGYALWVVRFDFSDHRRWEKYYNLDCALPELWHRISNNDSKDALKVIAFNASTSKHGTEKKATHAVSRDFSVSEVRSIPLFDLGVLFVHGIGPHKERETLIKFGEPIVKFWETWLEQVTARWSITQSTAQCDSFHDHALEGSLRNRVDHQGITRQVERMKNDRHALGPASSTPEPVIACGSVRVEDTFFPKPGERNPTSSLIRLTLLGPDAKSREEHVLMSESWWTQQTVYPSAQELSSWIDTALPQVFRLHIAANLEPDIEKFRYCCEELFGSANASKEPSNANLIASIANLLLSGLILALRIVVTLFKLPVMVLIQIALQLLALLGNVPVPAIKKFVRSIIDTLMGTVGQSYALKTSPMRRNAIVSEVVKDLEWLSDKCDKVAIVAHSQGAEVARLVLQSRRWPAVKRWITFGSGIKPLSMLEKTETRCKEATSFRRLFQQSSAFSGFLIFVLATYYVFGEEIAIFEYISSTHIVGIWCVAMALATVRYLCLCSKYERFSPNTPLRLSAEAMEVWRDFYATHDPVPSGSLFKQYTSEIREKKLPEPDEFRIHNARSTIRDHTSYFNNVEQFVTPVSLELIHLLGIKTNHHASIELAADKEEGETALLKAHESRRKWIWRRTVVRYLSVLGMLFFLVSAVHENWSDWLSIVSTAWEKGIGISGGLTEIWPSGIAKIMISDFKGLWLVFGIYITARFYVLSQLKQTEKDLYKDLASAFVFDNSA